MTVPRCLTIAASDSGGGAGIQADLRAFAAAGCHGMSVITNVTAQNTVAVACVHEIPVDVVIAQLQAVWDDIGVDAAKTGMLRSSAIIEAVADFLITHRVPLVVDPVMTSSTGEPLLHGSALLALRRRLLPLATVVTPNLDEARALAGVDGGRRELAERIHSMGPAAVVITGGQGRETTDHLYDGLTHVEISTDRHPPRATHGSGCTHSASLAALLARGQTVEGAARGAAAISSAAVARGLEQIGAGEGPVDVLGLHER